MAEPIDLPFGCELRLAEGSTSSVVFARFHQYVLMGGHIDATWQIHLNRPSAAAMQPFVKLLCPLVDFVVVCTGLHLG